MKVKKGFILREVAGNFVVVATGKATKEFNGLITLNESGAFLWKCLENEATKATLVEALLGEYEVDKQQAEIDVEKFIKKVVEAKLVE